MKTYPILMTTESVKAILAGNKTMTRRTIKPAIGWDCNWRVSLVKEEHRDGIPRYEMRCGTQYSIPFFKCPYGPVGTVLWVRETFAKTGDNFHDDWPDHGDYYYKADNPFNEIALHKDFPQMKGWPKWRNSRFIPKIAARLFLEVTDIRAERLQEITPDDCEAEGIEFDYDYPIIGPCEADYQLRASEPYQKLWNKLNGKKYPWESNPWVWKVSYKRIEKPIL